MSGVRLNIKPNFFTLNNKTMFFYLLFFYLLSESMATGSTNDSTNYNVTNNIICEYEGVTYDNDPGKIFMDAQYIPQGCDIILYGNLSINQYSKLHVDENILKKVMDLKKPVIVGLGRTERYSGWSTILAQNSSAIETKLLCDFAKNHSIQGYEFWDLYPVYGETVDRNVAKNIIPYIKQLKELCPLLIITAVIISDPIYLKNQYIYNFTELNEVLTFFDIWTLSLNECNPKLYNGELPITKSNTSDNHLYSLEEIVSNLKETEICFNKIVMTIPLFITNIENNTYPSYSQMCNGEFENSTMCVQTSKNYYEKGQFCSKHKFGILVQGVEWDDFSNACNCTSAFNGLNNIRAGYMNCMVMPCSKFDVQSTVYPYK